MTMKIFFPLMSFLFLSGCISTTYENTNNCVEDNCKIAIFFDGTSNTPADRTNVYRLFELLTYKQRSTNVNSLYVEGVGTEWYRKISGNVFGNGLNPRLKKTYVYIIDNYRYKNNDLYFFGFSRGAYNARALAGLLFFAGLPDVSGLTIKQKNDLVSDIIDICKRRNL